MKTNLKNRPEIIAKVTGHLKGIPRETWVNPEKAAIWFEDFEKELREKLVYPTNTKSIAVYDFIKEILGE